VLVDILLLLQPFLHVVQLLLNFPLVIFDYLSVDLLQLSNFKLLLLDLRQKLSPLVFEVVDLVVQLSIFFDLVPTLLGDFLVIFEIPFTHFPVLLEFVVED